MITVRHYNIMWKLLHYNLRGKNIIRNALHGNVKNRIKVK